MSFQFQSPSALRKRLIFHQLSIRQHSHNGRIYYLTDDSDTQWRKCMDACGLAVETQDAIVDPQFTYLRLSKSCLHWMNDTMDMRYAELDDIYDPWLVGYSEQRRIATGDVSKRHSTPGQQQQGTLAIDLTWSSAKAVNPPGHTVLYEAINHARGHCLLDEAGIMTYK